MVSPAVRLCGDDSEGRGGGEGHRAGFEPIFAGFFQQAFPQSEFSTRQGGNEENGRKEIRSRLPRAGSARSFTPTASGAKEKSE